MRAQTLLGVRLCKSLVLASGLAWFSMFACVAQAADPLAKAKTYLDGGEHKSAIIELKNILQQEPSMAEARLMLGRIYLKVGDGASADKELTRAKALGIEGPELQLDLLEAKLLQREFRQVIDGLEAGPEGDDAVRSRALSLQGKALIGLNRLDEARKRLNEAAAVAPDSIDPALSLVRLDIMQGKNEAALAGLEALTERHPDNMDAILLKAELLRKANQLEAAGAAYQQAIAMNPRSPQAHMGLATTYLAQGKLDEAEQEIVAAEAIRSDLVMLEYLRGLLAYSRTDYQAARERLLKVVSAMPNHSPTLLLLGTTSFQLGEYELAEEYIGRFLAANPGHYQASMQLALTRAKLTDYKGVIRVAEPLLSSRPEDVSLLVLLGSAYMETGDAVRGTEYLERAVELSPDATVLRTQLAKGFLARGETDKALIQLESAVDRDQESLQADVLLVLTYLRNREFAKAEKAAERLEQRKPNDPVSFNLSGLVFLAQQNFPKAAEKFNQALSVDPKFVTAQSNLARIDLLKQDFAGAEGRYRKMLEIEPGNVSALLGLAAIAEARKDKSMSMDYLQQAIAANPDNPLPSLLLANMYLSNNEPLKALSSANDLNNRFPGNASVLKVLARAQSAAGENSNAVRTLEQLIEKEDTVDNLMLLAGAQVAVKDTGGAKQTIGKVLQRQPDLIRAKLALVTIAIQEDNRDEALQLSLEIQQAHPDDHQGYQAEGAVRGLNGEYQEAATAYQRAYKLAKTRTLVLRLSDTYQKLDRMDDAITLQREWVQANDKDVEMRFLLAQSLQSQGQNPEAIKEYETIVAAGQDNPIVLNNLGWLYFLEDDPRALDTARLAHEKMPDRPEIADTYGWILLNRGDDPERALTLLQTAYVKIPTNPEMGYHVAVALYKLGRNDEAVRALRRLLSDPAPFDERGDAENLLRKLGG